MEVSLLLKRNFKSLPSYVELSIREMGYRMGSTNEVGKHKTNEN